MPSARHRKAQARLAAAVAEALEADGGFALPGSITQRYTRCGKPACRCKQDPPQLHGPYWQWTRTEQGKTVTRLLSPEQAEHYQSWIANNQRLRDLLRDLHALSVQAAEADLQD